MTSTAMLIDGETIGVSTTGATTEVVNPANDEIIASVPFGDAADVDRAVAAARKAFGEWSRTTPGERSELLHRLAAIVREKSEAFAQTESADAGKPIKLSSGFDVPGTIDNISYFAGAARILEGQAAAEYSGDHTSLIRREPIGVVGSVAPWNYPLQMAAWKLLPALAAGNTLVLKPSVITPLTTIMLVEACVEAGFPAGVVNLVLGPGSTVGQALMGHPDVDMVSLTGSTETGRQVMEAAAGSIKRVHLELGGKAPFVVFDDADLEAAVQGAVAGSLINSGQDCTAATRAYVHESLFDGFVDGVAETMQQLVLGDPADPATDQGPLVSRKQQESVAGFVSRAIDDGARAICGGRPGEGDLSRGAFYEPTLLVDIDQRSEVVQKEIFGPVLVALPFSSDEQAYELANDNDFGLAASLWTTSVFRAMEGARRIEAGTVWVNDHIPIISEMPHGGYKRSGAAKDQSMYSFEEYTQIKHVMLDLTAEPRKTWHRTIWG